MKPTRAPRGATSSLRGGHPFRFVQRLFSVLLAVVLGAAPAQATWTIVVMDTRTREVVLAGATCVPDLQLINLCSSVAVGLGGGVTQALVYHGAKPRIFNGLRAGQTPQEILDVILADSPVLQRQQFGVVGLHGPPVNFSGAQTIAWTGGIAGVAGDLRYTMQGNVLAGTAVLQAAEEALLHTEGDLGQRMMAAMHAAASQGGDGRCSCEGVVPSGCTTPPPGMTHTAYTSFLLIARLGDTDSTTCGISGSNCSNGDYYARLTNLGDDQVPDSVRRLQAQYAAWRADLGGRPDHFRTQVVQSDQLLQADGLDTAEVDVALFDVEGAPIVAGGATLVVTAAEDPGVTISPVQGGGDGTFHFTVTAGMTPGPLRLELVVQDGIRDVRLYPDVELEVVPATELFANQLSLSASGNGLVAFDLHAPARPAGAYHLLGSASGTSPGVPWGGLTLPLNRDRFLQFTALKANGEHLPGTLGELDDRGRASAWLALPAAGLQALVGGRLDFVAYYPSGPEGLSNPIAIEVVP